MEFLRSESGKKALAVGALVALLGIGFVGQRRQAVEDANKVCAVCAVMKGDAERKAVATYVSFNNEEYAVDSAEHAAIFKKNPALFAGKLHDMGLHDH